MSEINYSDITAFGFMTGVIIWIPTAALVRESDARAINGPDGTDCPCFE